MTCLFSMPHPFVGCMQVSRGGAHAVCVVEEMLGSGLP